MTATGTRAGSATAPLYAAGFVTAFGAHSIAAGLGAQSENIGLTLLNLGILLALYDVSESSSNPCSVPSATGLAPNP